MPEGFVADCQARLAFDFFTHTWNAVVIFALREGPRRPGELRTAIGGISPKVLTETLRRLERTGLVSREAYAEAPPRVEYALTALGRSLLEPFEALGRWSEAHADEVLAAQERVMNSG
ncbi:helix-turn-helix domain-containing protein [Actinomadura sp. DC4]|uniref:winged helix-turn-helix transcriptional regulator n=1 Tax=Actinomadura sp. DC4 TaxID=3055069 RepID=UPI0025AFD463|nr:helix-turn-helix domain-containing protein [Actinomadura sp. DC4]MDN3358378.1 helix-turn-helix domain-containing protein [Actinomadura sp. DC4]